MNMCHPSRLIARVLSQALSQALSLVLLVAISAVALVSAVPFVDKPAFAKHVSLELDGSAALVPKANISHTGSESTPQDIPDIFLDAKPIVASTPEAQAHQQFSTGATVLGAPIGTGDAVVLGDCAFGPLCWINDYLVKPIGNAVVECFTVSGFVDLFGIERLARCAAAVGKIFAGIAGWAISQAISFILEKIFHDTVESIRATTEWMLLIALGDNHAFSPQLACVFDDASNKECLSQWFINQLHLMHIIGLYILLPLLFLVIIQSIIKGSMFFLLRAVLIMLPASIIGGVVAVVVAQVLLNVVDQFCEFLVGQSMNPDQMKKGFQDAFDKLQDASFGFAALIWLLLLFVACVVIIIELILRQVGVYLAALFVPVAFATMVYPPTVRWARRALELLVAMIFMKLFLVGGLLVGISAMTFNAATVATPLGNNNGLSDTDQGLSVIITGVAVFFFAAFATQKMMAPLPVGTVNEGRITQPGQGFAAGDQTQTRVNSILRWQRNKLNRIRGAQKATINNGASADVDMSKAHSGTLTDPLNRGGGNSAQNSSGSGAGRAANGGGVENAATVPAAAPPSGTVVNGPLAAGRSASTASTDENAARGGARGGGGAGGASGGGSDGADDGAVGAASTPRHAKRANSRRNANRARGRGAARKTPRQTRKSAMNRSASQSGRGRNGTASGSNGSTTPAAGQVNGAQQRRLPQRASQKPNLPKNGVGSDIDPNRYRPSS